MRKITMALLIIVGGCVAPHPNLPSHRFFLGVPDAKAVPAPGTVWLFHESKMAEDGNTYKIGFGATTNTASIDTNSQFGLACYTDIQTNRWPVKRNHIDLSLDGGQTFPRRIGYGVNVDPNRINGEFVWSPPMDYTLMSTNAMLRIVSIGETWPQRDPPMPYDIPPGECPKSFSFTIAAIRVSAPASGDIVYAATPTTVRWMQSGGGAIVKVYWITQDTVDNYANQCLATLSNCVEMAWQERTITMPDQTNPQVKLVIQSVNDPNNIGYSKIFSVE